MQDKIATQLQNVLDEDLKRDFPNARLGHKHPASEPPTSRDRIGNTIEELENLVADLKTLIATLSTIKSKL